MSQELILFEFNIFSQSKVRVIHVVCRGKVDAKNNGHSIFVVGQECPINNFAAHTLAN